MSETQTESETKTNGEKSPMWPEIQKTLEANPKRYELNLVGEEISKRIEDNGGNVDSNLFRLKHLNFLEIGKNKMKFFPTLFASLSINFCFIF
jgi:hypothetical protein